MNNTTEYIKKMARIITSWIGVVVFVTGGLKAFVSGDVKLGLIAMILGIGMMNNMALCGIENRLDAMEKRLKEK